MVRRNVPLAQQVMREILSGIENKSFGEVDSLLPSEAELGRLYGVSRATIREALAQLESAGYIRRQQGVGTFINQQLPRIDTGLEELASIDTLARRLQLKTHYCDLLIKERDPSPGERKTFQISADTKVLSISRVIMANSRRVAYLIDVVPSNYLCIDVLRSSFQGSVLDILLSNEQYAISYSRTDILVESASPAVAKKLELQRGSALLKWQAQLVTRDGRVVDLSQSYFVPGYFRFHVIRKVSSHLGGE